MIRILEIQEILLYSILKVYSPLYLIDNIQFNLPKNLEAL